MKKKPKVETFRQQMAGSMAELRAIMDVGASPSNNGRLTVRAIQVDEPSNYDAKAVKKLRKELNVSQAIFARMVGVSDVLIRSWERGAREPAPVARRLLDQISAYPDRFAKLIHPFDMKTPPRRIASGSKKAG